VLLGEYEVEEERLRHDVDELVQQLSDKGLVTWETVSGEQ
jgi:hypothetical protein